ncbi:SDR family NAD(P)-dependent oxidoreductase [Hydrogenimonas thermophila]|uniref:NAD(P)-dependent dehydrogenase, short-chain alcohol dehydrogenase family n=1 Tax=Hydrogenimonas thermophila TaxID=223786 RepID=A0A1I5T3L7_9BACT|nr:SDR family NAD(P)-dependent oxidoreductase [Hydrogenimonas thermophila]SFP77630.1 NAD(P)-dependent dehydrogenase, short-chain alcohol dehydrogenase family [Hydrogenimonas thermophila]
MKTIFITGTNSGIGKALTETYLKNRNKVYGIGKKEKPTIEDENFHYISLDLHAIESIFLKLSNFLKNVNSIDIAILNAGILGEIKEMQKTSLYEIETVMQINVWANKVILDTFIDLQIPVKQIIGISSGAAVNASKGWGSYSLSKSALNMLLKLYSREMEKTHITALAPGVIETPMVQHIIEDIDPVRYPSVQRLKNGTIMQPDEAAKLLIKAFEKVKKYESGSFLDIRTME